MSRRRRAGSVIEVLFNRKSESRSGPKGYGALGGLRKLALALTLVAAPAWAGPPTLAALGDSLTQGYGLPVEDGLVPQLEEWLLDEGVEVEILNAGVSGDTTAGGLSRIDWTLTDEVDALMLALGGNDLLRGIEPATSRANLDAILEAAEGRGVPALLIGFNAPPNYGADYKIAFDAIYPDLAEARSAVLYPDFFAPFADLDPAKARKLYFQPDGLHPNAEGVRRIVEGLGPAVVAFLAER